MHAAPTNETKKKTLSAWHKLYSSAYLKKLATKRRNMVLAIVYGFILGSILSIFVAYFSEESSGYEYFVLMLMGVIMVPFTFWAKLGEVLGNASREFNRPFERVLQALNMTVEEYCEAPFDELFETYTQHLDKFSSELRFAESNPTDFAVNHELDGDIRPADWARGRFGDQFELGKQFGLTHPTWKPYFK
jgi:hypothetical protein